MGVTQREDIFQINISWNIPEQKAMRFHIGRTKQLPNTVHTKAPTTKPVTVNVQILVIGRISQRLPEKRAAVDNRMADCVEGVRVGLLSSPEAWKLE